MSTLQVNTIETNTPAGVLEVRDVNNALTAIQPGALRGTTANTAPVFQTSAGTEIGTLCRAWVNFNGTGTVAIRAAFNVSSITDNGVGSYTINFQNPMPDTNYNFTFGGQPSTDILFGQKVQVGVSYTTTSLPIITGSSTAVVDGTTVCVAVFR